MGRQAGHGQRREGASGAVSDCALVAVVQQTVGAGVVCCGLLCRGCSGRAGVALTGGGDASTKGGVVAGGAGSNLRISCRRGSSGGLAAANGLHTREGGTGE
jgi:hypothetical protein